MARSPLARVVVAASIAAALRTAAPGVMVGLAGLGVVAATAGPARAHHVGAYVPRDNEVSANFKQLKFSLQARKFEVAARLFETGALKRELHARAASLPPGLEAGIGAALRAGDARAAETGLMIFFAVLVRELALEADRQLADTRAPASARVAGANKFLEAIWRYYNLVDFTVSQRDPKAATAVRLAFDDAEGAAKATPPAPDRVRAPLQRIARVLGDVVAASVSIMRGLGSSSCGAPCTRGLGRDT